MKMKYLAIAVASLALTACGSTDKAAAENVTEVAEVEAVEQNQTQAEEANATSGEAVAIDDAPAVVELADDDLLRPGNALQQVTIVDFNATWCVPCKKFAPTFDEAAKKYKDVTFLSVDIDKNPETASAFDVNVVPTVIVLDKEGKVVKRYEGTGDLLPSSKFFSIVETVK